MYFICYYFAHVCCSYLLMPRLQGEKKEEQQTYESYVHNHLT